MVIDSDLSISRTTSSSCDDYVTISLHAGGNKGLIKVQLSIEELGKALLGLAAQPCTVDVRGIYRKDS